VLGLGCLVSLLDGMLVIPVEWNLMPSLGCGLVFLLDGILVIHVGWNLVPSLGSDD
jgi:hypothetical protein